MSRAKTIAIDGEKLKAMILASGRTLSEASEMLGGSKDYLSGICRSNRATSQCISLIGLVLNIPKDLFIVKEPESVSHETAEEDPRGIAELLADIAKDVRKLVELIEVKENEQKVWNLPFSDLGDRDHADVHAV